jgi:hypothetical protein
MTATRIMSIVGIVFSVFGFLCLCAFINDDPQSAIGWGVLDTLYLLAFSIVACVGTKNK